jgi:dolichol-phosphate mannosyltransferase
VKKNTYLVIIPTYNEVFNIIGLIRSINFQLPNVDILVIDDNSPDGTYLAVEFEMLTQSKIKLIKRDGKKGIATAYKEGFKYGINNNYTHLIQMDADGSHQVKDLKRLVDLSELEKSSVIIGSRYTKIGEKKIWNYQRYLLSKAANLYTKLLLKINLSDITSGFRVYPVEVIKKFNLNTVKGKDFVFQIEMSNLLKDHKIITHEIDIEFVDRVHGESKINFGMILESFIYVIRNR